MKKGFLRKTVALAAVACMVFAMSVSAGATSSSTTITTPSTVTNPVFLIGLPKTVTLALNPYEIGGDNAEQVEAGNYVVINKSNVPALVNVSIYPEVGANVTLLPLVDEEDAAVEVSNTPGVATKELQLYATFPAEITAKPGEGDVVPESGATLEDIAEVEALSTEKSFDFAFAFAAGATEEGGKTATVADANGWSYFTLGGAVNPYATWLAKDVNMHVVFSSQALTKEGYTAMGTDDKISADRACFVEETNVDAGAVNRIVAVSKASTTALSYKIKGIGTLVDATFYKDATYRTAITTGFTGAADGVINIADPSANATALYSKLGMNTFYGKTAGGDPFTFYLFVTA